jgi:glycosyltransferase involved in cell wall biosynthesis
VRILVVQSSRAAHHPRHHYRLAAALAGAGHDVRMLAQPDRTGGHRDAVPMDYLPLRRNRLTRMLSGPLTMMRIARSKPDVVYVVCLDLLPCAVLLKWLTGVAVLYDSSEQYDEYMLTKKYLPRPVRVVLRSIIRVVEPWLAARVDAATCAVPVIRDKFVAAGVRTTMVRNFPPAALAESNERGGPYDYDVIVAGTIRADGLPVLVDTIAEHVALAPTPPRWIVVCRYYDPPEQEAIERALTDADVRPHVDLRHNLTLSEVHRLLARTRVGLIGYPDEPYYHIALPLRVFEYLAIGLPFVSGRFPLIAELIQDRNGDAAAILTTPGDGRAYAAALEALLRDDELREAMSRNGPALVRTRYNWDLESRKLLDVVDDLPAARSGRSDSAPDPEPEASR